MAEGRTFGRFSSPSAFRIMAQAKKQGARKQAQEDWEKYQDAFYAYLRQEKSKGWINTLGDLFGMKIGKKMFPNLETPTGDKKTGSKTFLAGMGDYLKGGAGDILTTGLKGGMGFMVGQGASALANMIYGNEPIPEFKDFMTYSGPYSTSYTDPMRAKSKGEKRDAQDSIAALLDSRKQLHTMGALGEMDMIKKLLDIG